MTFNNKLGLLGALLILIPIIAYCEEPTSLNDKRLNFKIVQFDVNNHEISGGEPTILGLGVIPGEVIGSVEPLTPPWYHLFKFGENSWIDTGEFTNQIKGVIRASGHKYVFEQMSVTPVDTKFARIMGYLASAKKNQLSGMKYSAGFYDTSLKQYVSLMYFDRSCTIVGNVWNDASHTKLSGHYDISIPSGGYYWLRNIDGENGESTTETYEPKAPMFLVFKFSGKTESISVTN